VKDKKAWSSVSGTRAFFVLPSSQYPEKSRPQVLLFPLLIARQLVGRGRGEESGLHERNKTD
jgi:hypothetical protein